MVPPSHVVNLQYYIVEAPSFFFPMVLGEQKMGEEEEEQHVPQQRTDCHVVRDNEEKAASNAVMCNHEEEEEEEAFSPASTVSAMSLSSDASPVPSPAPSSETSASSSDWPGEPSRSGPVRRRSAAAAAATASWTPYCSREEEEVDNARYPVATHRSGFDEAHQAAFRGAADRWDCAGVARLLRRGAVDVDRYGEDGRTPLLRALGRCGHNDDDDDNELRPTKQQRLTLVRLLVQHGADVTLRTREGWSARHVASFGDCPEVVSYLLRCGRR